MLFKLDVNGFLFLDGLLGSLRERGRHFLVVCFNRDLDHIRMREQKGPAAGKGAPGDDRETVGPEAVVQIM